MKQKTKRIAIILTALCLCLIGALALFLRAGSDQAPELPEPDFAMGDPHTDTLVFRLWFETMSSTAGPCTVSVQQAIYEEAQAAAWWYAIQSDLAVLEQGLGLEADTPITVYLVETAPAGGQLAGHSLYCTPEDVLSGSYREGLIGAALIAEPWKQAGLARCLFDAEPVDAAQLAAYLEQADDLDILSLFAAYFAEGFAGDEEGSAAWGLAQLLCEHVISTHGGAALVTDACTACRQELLDELGVGRTYADPYGGFDEGFTYRRSADYPLIVTTERGDEFYLLAADDFYAEDASSKAAAARRFLYDACMGPLAVLEGVKTDAPDYADVLAEHYSAPFRCYFDPAMVGRASVTDAVFREIKLGHADTVVHELMHLLVPPDWGTQEQWKFEAIAQYLNNKYYPVVEQKSFFDVFTNLEETASNEEEKLVLERCRAFYLASAALPEAPEDVDALLAVTSLVKARYLEGMEQTSIADRYGALAGIYAVPKDGNTLSYSQALAFSDHLIRAYGLSAFLDYCLEPDAAFLDVYGMEFETAMTAWLEELLG